MNSCPTPHNLAPSAPISLSLVVLHPAICTFLCDSSHLLFSTFYLPLPLGFHTLFSSIFSPFLLTTSRTGLLIFLSSKVLLLCLSCLPDLHELPLQRSLPCLLLSFSHAGHIFGKDREDLILSDHFCPLSSWQPLLHKTWPERSCSVSAVRSQLIAGQQPASNCPSVKFL